MGLGGNATNIHGAGVVLRVNIHGAGHGIAGGEAVVDNTKFTPAPLHCHP